MNSTGYQDHKDIALYHLLKVLNFQIMGFDSFNLLLVPCELVILFYIFFPCEYEIMWAKYAKEFVQSALI